MPIEQIQTTCCIVGGGPAGMMLGYLLAHNGVQVTVLEKHKDFFRDFRGDTVHPSTLEIMYELGLLPEFLEVPHQEITSVGGIVGDSSFTAADFRWVPTHCKFIALMPQWDFLDFLCRQAQRFSGFQLLMQHEAVRLIRNSQRVTGVEAQTPAGTVQIRADLVIGCDGRHSTVRKAANLQAWEVGVPIDVLWFRLSRREDDPEQVLGNINYGKALILINRGEYFQAALIVRKGSFDEIKRNGLIAFRNDLVRIAPYLGTRVEELRDWDQIKLLSVQINRLRKWHEPGLLCIGDAAHAMSPAGGVGINLAIQDAVATANLLSRPLREKLVTEALLSRVQKRREFPTHATQKLQINIHKVFERVFQNTGPLQAPWQFKFVTRIPGMRHVLARVIGVGIRPEHIAPANPRSVLERKWLGLAVGAGALTGAVVLATTFKGHKSRRQ